MPSPEPDMIGEKESWRDVERRKNTNGGWTMVREIVGTIIGMLTVCVPLGIVLVSWGSNVESRLTSHAISIDYVHQEAKRIDLRETENESKVDHKLERIESKVDRLIERK